MKRNCPECDKEVIYKLRKDLSNPREVFELAIKNNTLCASCVSPRMLGKKHSKETIEIMKKNNVGDGNGMYGKKHSPETIAKIKAKRKLQPPMSEDGKRRVSEANKGKKLSKEHIEIIKKVHTGKKVSKETRRKMRIHRIKTIQKQVKRGGQVQPNYNINACKIIEKYGRENGYNFQHAENGGEYYVDELGYFVDGYDKEKNVVIEYYEKRHEYQKEKDMMRQQEIVDNLKCKFIIINE
tara:strand:- start:382 stop:1098 length:717 start_codon:yes stop_codon:yes gene_type:complete